MRPVFIRKFRDINIHDVPEVGGKNASLGEMMINLSDKGIHVPDGFAITATAFRYFLQENKLEPVLNELMGQLDTQDYSNLSVTGARARQSIMEAVMPPDLAGGIVQAYRELCHGAKALVAVRSSATAEDLPQASFAGQHESYLNIEGEAEVLAAVQKCFASLYTDRAIKYRQDNGFAHEKIALSAGVQFMVRSDTGCAGICFTLEPESGFRDVVHVSGVLGSGENIVQGNITPDEFLIFKPTLRMGRNAIIQKRMGDAKHAAFVLSDEEVLQLSRWALIIEQHYNKPMDIEWARDGVTGELLILQARPETVHSQKDPYMLTSFQFEDHAEPLAQGEAIGARIAVGRARIIHSPSEAGMLQPGEIIFTDVTSPDWDPFLKKAAAIITNKGGRTSHASIVARELGVPAVVGCGNATEKIRDGQEVTVSCAEGRTGYIYPGRLKYKMNETDLKEISKPFTTRVMLILGDPDQAFKLSFYPNDGVGLMRMEFIIANYIRIHPMALANFDKVADAGMRQQIESLTKNYSSKEDYFIDRLSQGIAMIAAAFYPKPVILRMSDFKTNEYANLIGGRYFEPQEENPMLGFRGASRYYNELYADGFRLECQAVKKVREQMGLSNVRIMIPFCRTPEEGRKVIAVMEQYGISRKKDKSLEIYVMAEIPSNVLEANEFAEIFDGFSIGSNDLTQLTLGLDRDSSIVSDLFSEQNTSVKDMIAMMIRNAKEVGIPVGLCGQAPSDFPEFAMFLVQQGIDSISFNPDALVDGIRNILKAESRERAKKVHC